MNQPGERMDLGPSTGVVLLVWGGLLGIAVLEVFLSFRQLAIKLMLILLMGLAMVQATLIISYFMHLRYERRSLILTLMPALIFVLVMMVVFFPDSFRLYHMKAR